jgi:hypothetical protein
MIIDKYLKPGKDIVVELDDNVEYILPASAVIAIKSGEEIITAVRVIDRTPQKVSARRIFWALETEGPADYLDSK